MLKNSKNFILTALLLVLTLISLNEGRILHKRDVSDGSSIDEVSTTESSSDLLLRLKLLEYTEKLKAKDAKKKAKEEKKAAKEKAFSAYLASLLTPSEKLTNSSPTIAPLLPPFGLWKKSFILSSLMALTPPPPPPQIYNNFSNATNDASTEDSSSNGEIKDDLSEGVKEMVKRYVPMLRKKLAHAKKHKIEKKESADAESEEQQDYDYDYEENNENISSEGEEKDDVSKENGKINKGGCSGSHIHICSGTTVYLSNEQEKATANNIEKTDEEESSNYRKNKKRGKSGRKLKNRYHFEQAMK